jgi:hypothetical protein
MLRATVAREAAMARKCFYSFEFKPDNWMVSTIRNIGAIDGSQSVSDNEWETITKGGDPKIEKWIADQMHGKSCTILLIGATTAGRKWINYEIIKTWNDKKGIFGIYIHNLRDGAQKTCSKGVNPFASINLGTTPLSSIVNAYDPPYTDSKQVYKYIADSVESWVDNAIAIRAKY